LLIFVDDVDMHFCVEGGRRPAARIATTALQDRVRGRLTVALRGVCPLRW
jgi:hypothetical protein